LRDVDTFSLKFKDVDRFWDWWCAERHSDRNWDVDGI